jgi:A/G-specific adenine glycosylase
MNFPKLHEDLLHWYDKEKRDLPWRASRDPYRIWISEIMLQQTRVETVIPYYNRFLSNFPTIQDLANAKEENLLNLWAGLGYYSRARNLKAAAQDMVSRFSGKMPTRLEDLRSLKGIGPYTSAAIASIAFDQPHAAIDGNLERVFSRLLNSKENPKTTAKALIEKFGASLVKIGRAGDLNQSVMDLSAKICLPKEPKCSFCPIQKHCLAHKHGTQREIPLKKIKMAPIELNAEAWAVIAEDALLLAKRPEGEWLSGMWDLPWWVKSDKKENAGFGEEFAISKQKRTITKHKIAFLVRGMRANKKPNESTLRKKLPAPAQAYRWVKLEDLHGVNLPRPSERALAEILK